MNIKAFPFFIVVASGLARLAFSVFDCQSELIVGWLVMSLGWAWICWTFWKNKNMPALTSNFNYENGANDFIRSIYAVILVLMYVSVAWFWQ